MSGAPPRPDRHTVGRVRLRIVLPILLTVAALLYLGSAVWLIRCPNSDVDWIFEADTVRGPRHLLCDEEPLINWLLPGDLGI